MQAIELKERLLDYRSKEAFKMLRTNIDFTGGDLKVICITSTSWKMYTVSVGPKARFSSDRFKEPGST